MKKCFLVIVTSSALLIYCAKGQNRIAFVGDSIVASWPVYSEFPNIIAENQGKSGSTISYAESTVITDDKSRDIDGYVFLTGTNDTKKFLDQGMSDSMIIDTVKKEYLNFIATVDGTGKQFVIISLLPVRLMDLRKNQIHDSLNIWLSKQLKSSVNGNFAKAAAEFKDDSGIMDRRFTLDGLHLNETGYDNLSNVVREYVYEIH